MFLASRASLISHGKATTHLASDTKHRISLWKTMTTQLVKHGQIVTTVAKAKELRRHADRVITWGKRGTLNDKRRAFAFLRSEDAVAKVWEELVPRFRERPGGYTRVLKLGPRKGDTAQMAIIQYVTTEPPPPLEQPQQQAAAAGSSSA